MPKLTFPASVGASIDKLYQLRETKRKADEVSAAAQADITAMEQHIFKKFGRQKLEGARGAVAQCSISQPVVPVVENWPKLYAFILKKKAFDLLQKRISTTAWRERVEAKVAVPGTKPFTRTVLNLTKVKKK